MIEYCVSNIQFQVIKLIAIGIAQGMMMSERMTRVPGKSPTSRNASAGAEHA